jgi:hypothetical protein
MSSNLMHCRQGILGRSLVVTALAIMVNSQGCGEGASTVAKVSEVRLVDGRPKLFVKGALLDSVAANVYYLGANRQGPVPGYSTSDWLVRMQSLIDWDADHDVQIIMPTIWWGDFDTSISRPAELAQNLDFSNLDKVMDYAATSGVYVLPIVMKYPILPQWWKKENNFPDGWATAANSQNCERATPAIACEYCETDSCGNVYNNASMNADKVQQDFGAFLVALLKRYRDHPALLGWSTGVGATAEENYGPNYIALMMDSAITRRPHMIADYSPFFSGRFKARMTEKYKTDSALQGAWSDTSVSLATLQIPKPREMLKDPNLDPILFPDPAQGYMNLYDSSILTQKGLDFYDFRIYMRAEDRRFYSRLFRTNDPGHIFLLTGGWADDVFDDPGLCDGLTGNPNLHFYGQPGGMNTNSYYQMMSLVKDAVQHDKLFILSAENFADGGFGASTPETAGQISYIETFGKAVRCEGGFFGYTADLIASDGVKWEPTWYSTAALSAVDKIVAYTPTSDCECALVKDLYDAEACSTKPQDALGCCVIDGAYESFCKASAGACEDSTGLCK